MASFLSQASSYFGRTNISINYTIEENQSPAHCGLWKIYKATRNAGSSSDPSAATNPVSRNDVSVWVHAFTAKGQVRTRILEQLKKEASSLTRLRHPCILQVVEPLEESRNEVTFATEQVSASLQEALVADHQADIQLDEVEIQKGLLQVARGLDFLHGAKMVHQNLLPESILINAKGDWKIAGFSFLASLSNPDGTPTPWSFPDYDPSLPPALSRNFDYMAPDFALDEKLQPENDMYSLGCIVYAVHNRGQPPFRNRNSLTNLRQNADQLSTVIGSSTWQRMAKDVLDLLANLLTRFPGARLNAQTFQQSAYFNSILVSTLKFMERENFAGRSKEERVQYLKGLLKILSQFSDRLLRKKVLPAVLELMTDRSLLPFILPNVFYISKNISSIEFTGSVLPKLKPLFQIQDPPQNMLLLLDQIELFVQKTSPSVFREDVTPLLYASLEAENVMVQEKALQTVPRLAEILEYAHVKEVLFPKIATLFAKTKVLAVKVNTLICFHSMVSILDKHTLTEKLVPILSRIKTKEPSVMVATLAVHETMSKKVDRETLATAIIPQLWTMSMGPLLNADQFARFMKAVKQMGTRVEQEHTQHLKEVKRMQEHTDSYVSRQGESNSIGGGLGGGVTGIGAGGEIDFATLVGNTKDPLGTDSREVIRDSNDPFGFDELLGGSNSSNSNSNTGVGVGVGSASSGVFGSTSNNTNTASVLTPGNFRVSSGPAKVQIKPPPSSTNGRGSSNSNSFTGTISNSSEFPVLFPPPVSSSSSSSSSTTTLTSSIVAHRSVSSSSLMLSKPPPINNWDPNSSSTNGSFSLSQPALTPAGIKPTTTTTNNGTGPNYHISLSSTTSSSSSQPIVSSSSAVSFLPKKSINTISTVTPPSWSGTLLQPTTTSSSTSSSSSSVNGSHPNAWKDFDPFS